MKGGRELYMRSMRSVRWRLIFRNREPLQKVCCGADTPSSLGSIMGMGTVMVLLLADTTSDRTVSEPCFPVVA
jgi:hypothetical protein